MAQRDTVAVDSVVYIAREIPEVIVTAYGLYRTQRETPASVTAIGTEQLQRYNNTNVLQAVNATPGVRMEERSPGSYRMNIRGSTLRSPFGVRNVKIYYNDIPLTDPAGFSYFNQLGFFNIGSLQIIRGPGSSIYGAGTGGVMLANAVDNDTLSRAKVFASGGSYGLLNTAAEVRLAAPAGQQIIRYQHQSSDGYRDNAGMARNTLSWDGGLRQLGKAELRASFLYNELNYETPGALTLAEYEANRQAARPKTAAAAGAAESNAHIAQQNVLAGLTSVYQLTPALSNTSTLYGSYTMLNNPTIRNYSRTAEPHWGGRTVFQYGPEVRQGKLQLLAGSEYQRGYVYARTYTNNAGSIGALQNDDETESYQYAGFAQATWTVKRWMPEVGVSVNKYGTKLRRLMSAVTEQTREYEVNVAPRAAVSWNYAREHYVYVNVANGFSPPTSAELLPTGGNINTALRSETGWNYEAGAKGNIRHGLSYEACVFYFELSNAIVLRRNLAGGDEYVNGGGSRQAGIEGNMTYQFEKREGRAVWMRNAWVSYTGFDFRYQQFVQVATDYSGKQLPGVAPHTVGAGVDVASQVGVTMNLTYFFSDKLPLNDANSVYANAYHLLEARLSYERNLGRVSGRVFAGVNNLLDQRYSLGNDINAAGGRYYNAAPGINYYAGVALNYHK